MPACVQVIEAHTEYEDALAEQLESARAKRISLFHEAKTRMQLMIQNPGSTIEEMSKVYQVRTDP